VEALSIAAFWLSLGCSALAALTAWAVVIYRPLHVRRLSLATAGGGSWDEARPAVANLRTGVPGIGIRLPRLLSRAVLAALLVSLAARAVATGYAPLTGLWEFTVALAAAVAAFQLVFERKRAAAVDLALQPMVLLLLVVAAALPSRIEPLAPALRSGNILVAHVAVMVTAYGALTVSFAAALLLFLQSSSRRLARLPDARAFDDVGYGAVVIGFPLLTLGIALGAYWASSAWGRYWGWDPKETSSLVTWLAYGVYFHLHSLRGWSGRRSAGVLVLAYGFVLFSYFGVNLWVSGLHSYAGG
jgi:cytochrome c-type biogenesis protein CcsB